MRAYNNNNKSGKRRIVEIKVKELRAKHYRIIKTICRSRIDVKAKTLLWCMGRSVSADETYWKVEKRNEFAICKFRFPKVISKCRLLSIFASARPWNFKSLPPLHIHTHSCKCVFPHRWYMKLGGVPPDGSPVFTVQSREAFVTH